MNMLLVLGYVKLDKKRYYIYYFKRVLVSVLKSKLKKEEEHQKKILTIDSVDIFHCYLATVSSGLKFKGTNITI